MFAASAGHVECVRLLTDAGADVDATETVRAITFRYYSILCFSQH